MSSPLTALIAVAFVSCFFLANVSANTYGFGVGVNGGSLSEYDNDGLDYNFIVCSSEFHVDSAQILSSISWQVNPTTHSHNTAATVNILTGLFLADAGNYTALAQANGGNAIAAINYDVSGTMSSPFTQSAADFLYPNPSLLSDGQTLPTEYNYAICSSAAQPFNQLFMVRSSSVSDTSAFALPSSFDADSSSAMEIARFITTRDSVFDRHHWGVRGDPQFIGLRGQSYQVHGVDGFVYAIISDHSALVNSRFAYINGPRRCPVLPYTGAQSKACWSHPGSYLSEVAVRFADTDNRYHFVAGNSTTGFSVVSITVNNVTVSIATPKDMLANKEHVADRSTLLSTHEVRFVAGPFVIELENIDEFINIRSLKLTDGVRVSQLSTHGLLGQTWSNKQYANNHIKEIEGEVDDYVVSDMFASDFPYNRFYSSD